MKRLALAGLCVWWMILAALAAMCAGCTTFTVPTKNGPIKYTRCFEKVYMRITDPDTGEEFILYTNDGGSEVAKSIASGVTGALLIGK